MQLMGLRAGPGADPSQAGYLKKPLGYSLFPKEIAQTPVHWAEKLGDLVWSKVHKGVSDLPLYAAHMLRADTDSKEDTLPHWSAQRRCGRTCRTSLRRRSRRKGTRLIYDSHKHLGCFRRFFLLIYRRISILD